MEFWRIMGFHGMIWGIMGNYGYGESWRIMGDFGILWDFMEFHGIS